MDTKVQEKPKSGMWFTGKGSLPRPPKPKPKPDSEPGGIVRQVEAQESTD